MQRAYEKVEKLALLDGLTGVANRRLLDQTLAREWISSKRDKLPLSVLLIDVDLFKSYNDQYGHLEGDECLRQVATRIQAVLRRPLDLPGPLWWRGVCGCPSQYLRGRRRSDRRASPQGG